MSNRPAGYYEDIARPAVCPRCGKSNPIGEWQVAGLEAVISDWPEDNPGEPLPADIEAWCLCPSCGDWGRPAMEEEDEDEGEQEQAIFAFGEGTP